MVPEDTTAEPLPEVTELPADLHLRIVARIRGLKS